MKYRITAVLILLVSVLPAVSQNGQKQDGKWKGDFTALLGGSLKPRDYSLDNRNENRWSNSKVSGSARLGYHSNRFFVDIYGNTSYSKIYSTSEIFTWKFAADTSYSYEIVTKENIVTGVTGGLDSGWNIDQRNEVKLNYSYTYTFINAANFKGNARSTDEDDVSLAFEDVHNTSRAHNIGASYRRILTPDDRELNVNAGFRLSSADNGSEWDVSDDGGYTSRIYRITPYSFTNDCAVSGKYSDKEIFNVKGLDADFSLACQFRDNKDYQRAATSYDGTWHDSLKYRDDFRFQEITVSPQAHAFYKRDIHILDVSYIPQFYIRRLSSITQQGDFNNGSVSHLFNISYSVTPWKYSRFALTLNRSVSRPNYFQTCWFKRAGKNDNHLVYQGNPGLLPSASYHAGIAYTFARSGFYVTPSVGFDYGFRIIEQTYSSDTIDGEKYSIYTWINSGENYTTDAGLKLGYGYKGFKTEFGGNLKYFHGIRHNGGNSYSSDYSLYANMSYENKGWKAAAKGYYQSAVKRNYNRITDIIGLDAHLEKKIGKVTIFLDGLNLLDRKITISTMSADENEGRDETRYNNNRIFQIGANFKF